LDIASHRELKSASDEKKTDKAGRKKTRQLNPLGELLSPADQLTIQLCLSTTNTKPKQSDQAEHLLITSGSDLPEGQHMISTNKRRESHLRITHMLRQLGANILRIMRGAGDPQDLLEQMRRYIQAVEMYRIVDGIALSNADVRRMLAWDHSSVVNRLTAEQRTDHTGTVERMAAKRDMVDASLHFAAAVLVNQPTQMARGDIKLYRSIARFNKSWKAGS
jgi:hypothetical protein